MKASRLLQFSLIALAIGCAKSTDRSRAAEPLPPPSLPKPKPKPSRMSFAVDPESPLWAPAVEAARQWSAALGIDVTVSPEDGIPIFIASPLSCPIPDNLPAGTKVGACSIDIAGPDARVEVPTDLPEHYRLATMLHEMGHHLRGSSYGEHLDDPAALMFGGKKPSSSRITPADVRFVCEALHCPDPPPGAS